MKIFGCSPDSLEFPSPTLSKDGVGKPQRMKGSAYTLENKTISSMDSVNYRYYDS